MGTAMPHHSPRYRLLLPAVLLFLATFNPAAVAAEVAFDQWLIALRAEALGKGISADTVHTALNDVRPIPRVIELDRRQPEFTMTFEQYIERVVPATRIQLGQQKLRENEALLREIGALFGVQPRFIVALWGIETNFGQNTGGFAVIPALATLAHDGRRSAFFRKELLHALTIIDQGHIAAADMTGSWAGAMGQNQFMPSSFLSYAVDHDRDGRQNIWTSRADIFASMANYLRGVGWRGDETWGRQVILPAGFNPDLTGLEVEKRLSEWQALGVRRADGGDLPARDLMASIVLPDGPGGRAYAAYNNYRSILKWNRSTYFATAVGHLSDAIAVR